MKTFTMFTKLVSRVVLSFLVAFAFITNANAQINVSGGTGLASTYTSFTKSTGLFAALNATTQSGAITVSITSDVTDEDGATSLNAGAWSSITVTPSGSRTISGSVAGHLLNFNGADNVTINGLTLSGANSLTISNNYSTNTTNAITSAIRFINDATNNTITNCTIKAAGGNTTSTGAIFFSTGTTTGNDNNTISNNNITASTVGQLSNGIYSLGTSVAKSNDNNTVSGNNIYDYFMVDSNCAAVFVGINNSSWTISNNRIYQTAERQYNAASVLIAFYGINVHTNALQDGFTISGNTIGGNNSAGTGQLRISTNGATTGSQRVCGIQLSAGTNTVSTISNNTIANIYNASFATSAQPFSTVCGIAAIAGSINITNNTIGATSGATGSLYAYVRASGVGAGVMGIYTAGAAPAVQTISSNTIGSLVAKDSLVTHSSSVYGMYINNSANNSTTINNNTVGNSTANNMVAGTSGSTTASSVVMGIHAQGSAATYNCYSNTVQNLSANGSTGVGTFVRGIGTGTSISSAYIYNNTINNLTSNGIVPNISSGAASAVGILIGSSSSAFSYSSIYGNTITNISNTNATANTSSVIVAGIVHASAASNIAIYKNTINSLSNAGTGTTALQPPIIAGVVIMNSTATDSVYNNMISLGTGLTTNTVIAGIWAQRSGSGVATDYILHNTVNIAGTQSSGSWSSFCFHRGDFNAALSTSKTNAVVIKNNIFTNSRTGGTGTSAQGHYAISNNFASTVAGATTLAGWSSNFNILNSASTTTVGWHGTTAYTFTNWKAITTMLPDANSSTAATVNYVSATDLHMASSMGSTTNVIESAGDPTVYLLSDFDGDARPGPVSPKLNGGGFNPDLGADEFDGKFTATCSGTPTAPNAQSSAASVTCYGSTVNLSLASAVTGTGISYQWQVSTTSSSTGFSNITGAVGTTYTATPTTSSNWYRCVITCVTSGLSANSAPVAVTGPGRLSGPYTINSGVATGGTNYNSFKSAFAALNCNGVSGPVTFNVASGSGPYNEQDTLSAINGASATNTITFNGNGRTLNFASTTSAHRTGIVLNGASYVTFDNLKIDTLEGSTYNWGFLFINNANYNTISNCVINVGIVSTVTGNTNGIVFSSSGTAIATAGPTGNYNTITGNTIRGGFLGISINGNIANTGTYITGNVISNNIIRDFYSNAISVLYNKNLTISGNDISRPNRTTSTSVTAISLSTGGDGIVAKNNKIHNIFDKFAATHTNAFTGIITSSGGTLGNENKIFNNVIYNIAGNGSIMGIQNQSGYYQIYHNTLFFGGLATTATTTGIQTSGSTAGIDIRNNMVYISRTSSGAKRCINVSFTPPSGIIDYNNYYINTNSGADYAIGQYLSAATIGTTLSSWQSANANGYDANSFSVDPLFADSTNGDFTPTSATIDEVGTPVGIATDVLGNTRSTTDPDLGAYEFASNPCTDPATPGVATTSAATVCSGTSFTLGLSGTSVGSGQRYQWQDSIPGGAWNNITASVQKLQTYTTSQTLSRYYRAMVQCNYPTGTVTYTTPVYVYTPAQLNGTYTINKSAAATTTNFTSFTSAVAALGCGITGPVTFNVLNGPYNEQVTMTAVSGASSTNRIKFNGNGQTLSFASSVTSNRHTFGLNAASYITVNNLVINASTGTFGTGVWLNNATYDSITNCTINLDLSKTNSDFGGIIMSPTSNTALGGNNNSNNCAFVSNTINGGYAGIVLFGNSSINQLGNSAINNTITNAHNYGIYIVYQDGALVRGNDMYSTTRTAFNTTSYTGIAFAAGTTNTTIDRNKIHNIFDAATNSTISFVGISVSGSPTLGKEHKVTNNLIYGINHDGSIIGITTLAASYNNIYHNTIILNNPTTNTTNSTTGITINGAPSYNNIKNNLVYIGRGGTGTKVCVNRQQSSSFGNNIFDRNNVYLKPGLLGNNYLAQDSTLTFTDINAWRADTYGGGDANATNIKVSFANAAVGNYSPFVQALDNLGAYIPGVDFDINGNPRSNTTPDIGAYEFSLTNCSGTPTAGTAFSTTSNACYGDNFTFDLTGNSLGLTQTYQWQKSANGVSGWSSVGALLDYSSAELTISQTTSNYYRCKVSCSGNDAYSNVVYISTPDLVSGTFTIDKNNPTIAGSTYQTFAEAISYISCGINGAVVLNVASGSGPYNEQFTIPAINGTSSTNTITINGNGETLAFSSTVSTNRNGITLNGADWVTINNLNIDMSTAANTNLTTYFGTGICLTNFADNNTITNCTIDAGRNTTNPNMACITITGSTGVLTAQGNAGSNNIITGCNIYGGYYGVYLYGLLNFTGSGNGNIISNNQLVDNYNAPVAVTFQSGTIVRNNEIYKTSTRTNYSSVTYGVYMSTQASSFTIEKNKIHDLYVNAATNTGPTYCIYVSSSNTYSTVGSEAKVINNLVYNMISDGTTYGIYSNSPYTWYFHNTIVLDYAGTSTTTGATYGFYTANAANSIVKNNNFYVTRGSTSTSTRGFYLASTGLFSMDISNNNIYFNPVAGTNNNLVQYGTSTFYNTLSDFQTAWVANGGVAANNVSVNPSFVNPSVGNYAATSTSLNGVGAINLGVTTDILGNNRTVFFTPGCYEVDNQAPTFANATIAGACSPSIGASSISLNGVTIADGSGVQLTGANMPRIYFRKGTGTWYSAQGTMASGNSLSSNWNFTINYSVMGGVSNGDVINYFVAAQDVYVIPNVGASASGIVATSVNSITTYPSASSVTVSVVTPSVSISTAKDTVCSGANTNFTASGVNTGSAPVYQWMKNGVNVSSGSSITFPPNTLTSGDEISCMLTANNVCQTTSTALSNVIRMVVNITPTITSIINQKTGVTLNSALMCNLGDTLWVGNYSWPATGSWVSSNTAVATATTGQAYSYNRVSYVIALSPGVTNLSYSITSTTSSCQSALTIPVTVAPNNTVVAPILGGSAGVCVGSTLSLSNATSGGVWSSGGRLSFNSTTANPVTLTGLNAGTSLVKYTVTNAQGCSVSNSYNLTINSLPATPTIAYASGTVSPQTANVGGLVTLCTNRTFTLVGNPANGVWTKTGVFTLTPTGTPSTNVSVYTGLSPQTGGNSIKYEITSAAGCKSSRTIAANVAACASKGVNANSISSIVDINNFTMYPNPANSVVNIKLDKLIGEGSIVITDMYGKQVKKQALSIGSNTIDIFGLSKGMYMVSIITTDAKATKKLVIE